MNRTIGHKLHGKGPQKVIVLHDWFGDTATNYDPMLEFLDGDAFTFVQAITASRNSVLFLLRGEESRAVFGAFT